MARRQRSRKNKSSGGGWTTDPSKYISAGYLENTQYSGVGKDCVGTPVRAGYIGNYTGTGLPGHAGGSRRKSRGGTRLEVASFHDVESVPLPSAPGVPPHAPQKGGRYGNVEFAPLSPNGVGSSGYASISHIACENSATTANRLNGLPMRGGSALGSAPVQGLGSGYSAANFPLVSVGAADSMRYYVPTAGYTNRMEAYPAGGAVGGLTMQDPINGRSFNQACLKTGGSRNRKNKKGGAQPVALQAGAFSRVAMEDIGSRFDFDGTKGGLPVKFGGSYRKRHTRRNKKHHKTRRVLRK